MRVVTGGVRVGYVVAEAVAQDSGREKTQPDNWPIIGLFLTVQREENML